MKIIRPPIEATPELNQYFGWGSHIPLNLTVFETFDIKGVLELGAGMHSTPMFFKNSPSVVTIEQNKEWIKNVKEKIGHLEDDNHKILLHEGIPTDHQYKPLVTPEILNNTVDFYNEVTPKDTNMLFVDHFNGFRAHTLNNLYEQFDIILYHDAQPEEHGYGYSTFNPDTNDYYHFMDETYRVHTGIVISKKFSDKIEQFKENHARIANEYSVNGDKNHKYTPTLVEYNKNRWVYG